MITEQLLTVEQAASRLHLHPGTLRRHLRDGILRGIKRGHSWRIPETALTEHVPGESSLSDKSSRASIERDLALLDELREMGKRIARDVPPLPDDAVARSYEAQIEGIED